MKRFGILAQLPQDHPLRKNHLLGEDFQYTRWYPSAAERDAALLALAREHPYSRRGDVERMEYRSIERKG